MIQRPTFDETYIAQAAVQAKRATCRRRRYAAIVVDNNRRIISTGHCGAPVGRPNCCDEGVICERDRLGFGPGEGYDHCCAVHAEANAICYIGYKNTQGCTLYIAGIDAQTGDSVDALPCKKCHEHIINSGITRVVIRMADNTIKDWDMHSHLGKSLKP